MKLVVESITIVDLNNKEAKKVDFISGKNLLYSARNHVGKSIIMKSIYYTLGAEVFFSAPAKAINLLTILTFKIDEIYYKVARYKKEFALISSNGFSGTYHSVGEFSTKINEIFNFEINLVGKDQDKSLVTSPPVFFFLPYYIDQEYGWSNANSFNNLSQFDIDQRRMSYYFHFNSFDSHYVRVFSQQKTDEHRILILEQEIEKLELVIATLELGLDSTRFSFDADVLSMAINSRQVELEEILSEIEHIREVLVKAEDELTTIQHEKEIISKYLKHRNKSVQISESENIDCPRCGLNFSSGIIAKLQRTYLLESLNEDYGRLLEDETKFINRRNTYLVKFSTAQQRLNDLERSLRTEKSNYDIYLRAKATKSLIDEYTLQIEYDRREKKELVDRRSSLRKELSKYAEMKKIASEVYTKNFDRLLDDLDIPKNQVEGNSEPGELLDASGAYGPRCKVSQILAFVKSKAELSRETISFPIVIDSPNTLEQDDTHLDAILRKLFSWSETDNQIIIASLVGREIAESIPGVNVIVLDNQPNHVMSNMDYEENFNEISNMLLLF